MTDIQADLTRPLAVARVPAAARQRGTFTVQPWLYLAPALCLLMM